MKLLDDLSAHGVADPFWTLGGGTVLMLRYRHRRSKDIDIFIPDPQYLAYLTPRLNSTAEAMSDDYVEAAGHVKLIQKEGEIDFVATPNLTDTSFEIWNIGRRRVRVETAVEIVAKKMWHRGHIAAARDLFDLSLVIEREGAMLAAEARFLTRHQEEFLSQIRMREKVLRAQYDQIDVLDYRSSYDECVDRVERFLGK